MSEKIRQALEQMGRMVWIGSGEMEHLRKRAKKVRQLELDRNRLLVDLYNQGRQMDEMAQMIGYQQMEIRRLKAGGE